MAREPRDPRRDTRDKRDPRQLDDPIDTRDPRVVAVDPRDERRPGDARDERTVVVSDTTAIRKAPAAIIVGAYTVLGLDLCLAPFRWSNTPAYGTLLRIFPQPVWGAVLLTVAAALAAATWLTDNRAASFGAHFAAIVFTAGWAIAFVARRVTDDGTTAMNATTWSVMLAILVFSMRTTEKHQRARLDRPRRSRV